MGNFEPHKLRPLKRCKLIEQCLDCRFKIKNVERKKKIKTNQL